MINNIKLDILNCIKNKKFKIIFFIFFLLSSFQFLSVSIFIYGNSSSELLSANELSMVGRSIGRNIFDIYIILIPFIVNFIYSDSFLKEYTSNIHTNIIIRKGLKKYIYSKAIVSFLITSITIFSTLYINKILIYLSIPKGINIIENLNNLHVVNNHLLIIMNSIIAGLIALTTFTLTVYFKHINSIIIFAISSSTFFFITVICEIFKLDLLNVYYYQQGEFEINVAILILILWAIILLTLLKIAINNHTD